eukprot:6184570-Pleurochrysis_carterae.AAC.1
MSLPPAPARASRSLASLRRTRSLRFSPSSSLPSNATSKVTESFAPAPVPAPTCATTRRAGLRNSTTLNACESTASTAELYFS